MTALVTGATGFWGADLTETPAAGRARGARAGPRPGEGGLPAGRRRRGRRGRPDGAGLGGPALAGVDTVFHCAAQVTNWAPWSEFLAVTVRGTENLLAAAARVPLRRFVHVSTVRVYDDRPCRRLRAATEETPLGAASDTSATTARAKVMAEALVWRRRERCP